MESRKRAMSTNNNSYSSKKIRISSSFQPEDLCDLGLDVLSDSESESDPTSIYNDYDRRTAKAFDDTRKLKPLPKSDFIYKLRGSNEQGSMDLFGTLPDELVMGVLRFLDKKSLMALSLTSHRFDRLCHDEALWPRLNLTARKLDIDNIGDILRVGVKVLRLSSAIFPSPIWSQGMSLKLENFVAKVRFLDLSYVWIKVEDLALLLSKMQHLIKLSLESVGVNVNVVRALVKNTNLEALNLAMATGLNHQCVYLLAKNLPKLESLNLAWTGLEGCAYSSLANELSACIKHLDISGSHLAMKNDVLVTLVNRCPHLQSLDVSDSLSLSAATLREIVKSLPDLRSLGLARCYQLELQALLVLGSASKLENLSAYRLLKDREMDIIRLALPSVKINKNPLSVIARPTVGIRRTSIWELPTSD